MSTNKEFFDEDTVSYISGLVENKSNILNNIDDFQEKDKMLSLFMEEFENDLSEEDKEKFDKVMRLMYEVEEYYITLAY